MNQKKQNDQDHQQDQKWIALLPEYHQDWVRQAISRGDSKEEILKRLAILEQTM